MKLANTSFIQTSSNHRIVTRSPNHMCDVSCAIVLARLSSWFCVALSSSIRLAELYRIAPACSMPPNWNDGIRMKSSLSKGYGMAV
jgi:hypothetical protein